MCWHLQDNLVEPPNELQECLQNRDQIGIVTYTQDSELSSPIKPQLVPLCCSIFGGGLYQTTGKLNLLQEMGLLSYECVLIDIYSIIVPC